MEQKTVERNYGRKVIRDGQGVRQTKSKNYARRFFLIMGCTFMIGFVFGSIVTGIIVHKNDMKKLQRQESISSAEVQMIESSPYGSGNNVISEEGDFTWTVDDSFIPLDVPMDTELQQFVFELSASYNIDWTLVMAMIDHESSWDSDCISKTNDYGLMQINVCNHEMLQERLGITDFLDEEQNIRSGLYVLSWLFKKYDGDVHKVLMAYNMGEGGCENLWNSGVHSTSYSRTITAKQAEFQQYIEERMGETNE